MLKVTVTKWCEKMSKSNIVFVSGYSAPPTFLCVLSDQHKMTGVALDQSDKTRVEKLYLVLKIS